MTSNNCPVTASSASVKKRPRENNNSNDFSKKGKRGVNNTATQASTALTVAANNSNWKNCRLQITIHFDGGSRGNPGVAGAGAQVVVAAQNISPDSSPALAKTTTIYSIREYCGERATNNYAEYKGLIAGLERAKSCIERYVTASKHDDDDCRSLFHLQVYGDSNLIIQQLRGAYQCRNANIRPLFERSARLIDEMRGMGNDIGGDGGRQRSQVSLDHVYRDKNKVADALANEAMDRRESWTTTTTESVGDGMTADDDDDDGGSDAEDGKKPLARSGDKKPPAVVASMAKRGKNNHQFAVSSKSGKEVIDVDDDSDNDSHYSV